MSVEFVEHVWHDMSGDGSMGQAEHSILYIYIYRGVFHGTLLAKKSRLGPIPKDLSIYAK